MELHFFSTLFITQNHRLTIFSFSIGTTDNLRHITIFKLYLFKAIIDDSQQSPVILTCISGLDPFQRVVLLLVATSHEPDVPRRTCPVTHVNSSLTKYPGCNMGLTVYVAHKRIPSEASTACLLLDHDAIFNSISVIRFSILEVLPEEVGSINVDEVSFVNEIAGTQPMVHS